MRRVEPEEGVSSTALRMEPSRSEPIVAAIPDGELETALLPHDHPRWVKDAVAVSQRAREIIAKLRPIVIRVLSFWDHRVRSIAIGDCRVDVDVSGCYRVS
ncbi:MAG: hypothetical protein JO078_09690 [Candidatus Eremiobacteraeota bacterium]|nr:hypothetical protein [Candidatus Eremiobacteraeota bacterium]